MRRGLLSLAGAIVIFAAVSVPCPAQEPGTQPAVAKKTVSVKAEDGLIQSIELANSGKGFAFGCVTAQDSPRVIWKLTARGKPAWRAKGFSLKDDQGREFEWFCRISESNERGVWITETIYLGPRDSKRVTVKFAEWSAVLTLPEPGKSPAPPVAKKTSTSKKTRPTGAGNRGWRPW